MRKPPWPAASISVVACARRAIAMSRNDPSCLHRLEVAFRASIEENLLIGSLRIPSTDEKVAC